MKLKTLVLIVVSCLALMGGVLDASAQGVLRARPGTEGVNDFWIREIVSHTYPFLLETASDSIEKTIHRIPLYGSKYDITSDTIHRVSWAFENLTDDTLIVTIAKNPETQYGNTPLLADLAGYEPTNVTVEPGQSIHYYWTFGIYTQFIHVYVKVKTQASNVSISPQSKWRFYLVGF